MMPFRLRDGDSHLPHLVAVVFTILCRWTLRGGLVSTTMLQACSPAPDHSSESLPTLAELRVARGQSESTSKVRRSGPTTGIRRVDLPLDAPLDAAWLRLTTRSIPPQIVASWRRNGLRAGVLPQGNRRAFLAALGPVYGHHTRLVVGYDAPIKLASSPGKLRSLSIILPTADNGTGHVEIKHGTAQLLLHVIAPDNGQRFLTVTPYHDVPPATTFRRPRRPQETPLVTGRVQVPKSTVRGTLFRELAITVALRQGETLIIGPHVPTATDRPQAPDHGPRHDTPPPERPSAEQHAKTASGEEDTTEMRSLGRVILTAKRLTRPIKSIYLVDRPRR